LNQIKSKVDHPSPVATRQFMRSLFMNHPYAEDPLGTVESVGQLTPKDLQAYFAGFATAGNMTVSVVGDFKEKDILARIERIAKLLPQGSRYSKTDRLSEIKQNQFVYSHMKKEQSHLVMGYHGLSVDAPERYVLQLMDSVLSGMGGRLFNELREKNSLAYSVAPQKLMGPGAGSFGAYIGCSPEKVDQALQMMLIEFNKLADVPVPESELERCRRYLIGSHDIDLQRKSSLATQILFEEIYGLDSNEIFQAEKIFRSISGQDIKKLASKLFDQKFVCSVVGPKDLEFRPK
jgi:zinc protease